jgi:hypothetical protein
MYSTLLEKGCHSEKVSQRLEKSLQCSTAYDISDVDAIVSYMSWTDREKTDELLRIDASRYANLGTESTVVEKQLVKNGSVMIYTAIKTINHEMGDRLLRMIQDETE